MPFPVDAFINARKFQVDQANQPNPIATAVGETGVYMAQRANQNKQLDSQRAFTQQADLATKRGELFKDFVKTNALVNEQTGDTLRLDELAKEYQNFTQSGQISPNIKVKPIQSQAYQYNPATGQYEATGIGTGSAKTSFLAPVKQTVEEKTSGYKEGRLAAQQPKAVEKVYAEIESNNNARSRLNDLYNAVQRIQTGLGGKAQEITLQNLKPNDPLNADWQIIRDVLTDAQFQKTMQLKGAISDRENALAGTAAANTGIISMPKVMQSAKYMLNKLNANEKGIVGAYKRNYGEDPLTDWGDLKSNIDTINFSGNQNKTMQLQVGTIENGYKYLGGDPSNPSSWQEAK